ncbi:hypothetical protein K523DRAFT_319788 [Schizophyllum commune Tattone D]|nr:hypothetical protein K523DRAFT_319788 [Schizophyllum commune Tattone D]
MSPSLISAPHAPWSSRPLRLPTWFCGSLAPGSAAYVTSRARRGRARSSNRSTSYARITLSSLIFPAAGLPSSPTA